MATVRTVFPAGLAAFIGGSDELQLLLLDAAEGWVPAVGSVTVADIADYEATFAYYSRQVFTYETTATASTVRLTADDIVFANLGTSGDSVGALVVATADAPADDGNLIVCTLSGFDAPLTGNSVRIRFAASGFLTFTP